MTERTRLLIVDDSALYRQTISNVLRDAPDVEVVGVAKGGREAIEKITELDPDLLTLDVQMPDMDGITVLREINARGMRPRSIMVSSLTSEGAQVTTDALLEGAFDFILKPTGGDPVANLKRLRSELDEKIAAFRVGHRWRTSRDRRRPLSRSVVEVEAPLDRADLAECRAVVVGTSTGGPAALRTILAKMPATLPVPIVVVQHMPARYTATLAQRLDEQCPPRISEATDGGLIEPGTVTIAPGGRQMKLVAMNGGVRARVTDDAPENGCRPSVDYLLRSVVDVYDGKVLAVIMTGMGRDGLAGCEALNARGGFIFAQHEDDCTVYGMPKAIVEAGIADRVVRLDTMTRMIVRHVERRRAT